MNTTTRVEAQLLSPGDIIELEEVHFGRWEGRIYKVESVYPGQTHTMVRLHKLTPHTCNMFDLMTTTREIRNTARVALVNREITAGFPL